MRLNSTLGTRQTMAGNPVPIGTPIQWFINAIPPNGYLPCNGQAVSRTIYPILFGIFGTYFGVGDGSTTFNLPDYNTGAVDMITYVKALDILTGLVTDANTLGGQIPDFYSGRTMKNKLINGNFDIWQRGNTQTVSGYGSDDRWYNGSSGSTKVHSQQAFTLGQVEVPGNPTYFSRTVVTSVAGTGNYCCKTQAIESVVTVSGKTVTLSFWAKADSIKSIGVEFLQCFGGGGSPSSTISGIGTSVINLTASWKKYTVSAQIPSVLGKTLGTYNSDFLQVGFWFDAGTSLATRTNSLGQQSGTFDIAQVQLEEGSVATTFESRHIQQEIALCQRYYEKSYDTTIAPGTVSSNGILFTYSGTTGTWTPNISFKQTKRTVPTMTPYSVAGTAGYTTSASSNFAYTITNIGANGGSTQTMSSTSSVIYYMHWTADAEL